MRIGITAQTLDPTWGGIGIYTEEIIDNLLKIDPRNHYVLIYPGFGEARRALGRFRRQYPNVAEIETPASWIPTATYWDQIALPKVVSEQRLDVLFNPFWTVPYLTSAKKVIVMHNVERYTLPNVYDLKNRVLWFLRDNLLMGAADCVISISNVITEDLKRHYKLAPSKVRTIHHGVSDKFHVIQDADRLRAARDTYRLPDQFILFVGNLYPQKNFGNTVRAFRALAPSVSHDLVVAGQPRWNYRDDLALVDTLGLRERVRFLGFVPHDDLPLLYNLADCFVYPSLYEAFGLAGLEAMACGCPMAGAATAAIPEVAQDAALLFDPHDPDAIAACLHTLLHDQAQRRRCIEAGLARARHFTWRRCATETLELFNHLVAA